MNTVQTRVRNGRLPCRRPLNEAERDRLGTLGYRLQQARLTAGLSQLELAGGAQLHVDTVSRIERGVRRTRRSTLHRIAAALVASGLDVDVEGLVDELVVLAGPALAPESRFAERIARRRARRWRRRRSRDDSANSRKEAP